MEPSTLETVLTAVAAGRLTVAEALDRLKPPEVRWDHDRRRRRGFSETVLGTGKTFDQVLEAVETARERPVLVTRVDPAWGPELERRVPDAVHHPVARAVTVGPLPPVRTGPPVAIVTAGTADRPVAEEARLTLRVAGIPTEVVYDVGVAGIHRLFGVLDTLRRARVVICIAGMEGALPGVVAALLAVPVIGVPTSVGLGAHAGGFAPLLTMLNSCAEGLAVVNIDNGFGAARLAQLIWQTAAPPEEA
ncbi:MAG: nickel pincer cofactor biosynthesis protein LarB [Actinomycetia bacterium]|nr:nickel pincer cofactor biosynthesis protein LarB [Actinomycetes bacterium]